MPLLSQRRFAYLIQHLRRYSNKGPCRCFSETIHSRMIQTYANQDRKLGSVNKQHKGGDYIPGHSLSTTLRNSVSSASFLWTSSFVGIKDAVVCSISTVRRDKAWFRSRCWESVGRGKFFLGYCVGFRFVVLWSFNWATWRKNTNLNAGCLRKLLQSGAEM